MICLRPLLRVLDALCFRGCFGNVVVNHPFTTLFNRLLRLVVIYRESFSTSPSGASRLIPPHLQRLVIQGPFGSATLFIIECLPLHPYTLFNGFMYLYRPLSVIICHTEQRDW